MILDINKNIIVIALSVYKGKPKMYRNQSFMMIFIAFAFMSCTEDQPKDSQSKLEPIIEKQSIQAKSKIDILLYFSNDSQMKDELQRFSSGFSLISKKLIDEKQDFRIAVISNLMTDGQINATFLDPKTLSYDTNNQNLDIELCQKLPQIISSQEIYALSKDDLIETLKEQDTSCPRDDDACELAFYQQKYIDQTITCFTSIDLSQSVIADKGLETIRKALACEGSNEEIIDQCCAGRGVNRRFNTACTEDMAFLRTDATLLLIPISDQNDCSHPSDFSNQSEYLICHNNGLIDENQDGILDLYEQAHGSNAGDIYTQHCGMYSTALDCQNALCHFEISMAIECQWNQEKLTHIQEFRDFLMGLKKRNDQLIFAPIVGFRNYDKQKNLLSYQNDHQELSADCQSERSIEKCCKNGVCPDISFEYKTCDIPNKKVSAYAGTRYLELAQALKLSDLNQVTCEEGQEPIYQEFNEQYFEQAKQSCLHICSDQYDKAFEKILGQVTLQKNKYCFDAPLISIQEPCDQCSMATVDQSMNEDRWLVNETENPNCLYELEIKDSSLQTLEVSYQIN